MRINLSTAVLPGVIEITLWQTNWQIYDSIYLRVAALLIRNCKQKTLDYYNLY